MNREDYWFEKQNDRPRPVAIHWKGRMFETLPVVFSALWVASFLSRVLNFGSISEALPFSIFSVFCAAQGAKYYFYHEKTKS